MAFSHIFFSFKGVNMLTVDTLTLFERQHRFMTVFNGSLISSNCLSKNSMQKIQIVTIMTSSYRFNCQKSQTEEKEMYLQQRPKQKQLIFIAWKLQALIKVKFIEGKQPFTKLFGAILGVMIGYQMQMRQLQYFKKKFRYKQKMKNNTTLILQTLTWEKDSHGLYDYEGGKTHKSYFEIEGPCKIFKNWHTGNTKLVSNDDIKAGRLPSQDYTFVSSLNVKHTGNYDTFILNPPEKPSQELKRKESLQDQGPINTNAYIVVRYFQDSTRRTEGYPLVTNQIVKLGRVEFKVVEIGGFTPKRKEKKAEFLGDFNCTYNAVDSLQGTCKFCLGDENAPDNFLISPCNCKGSCEGVHVQCLKMWIDSKVKKQTNGVVCSYNFTKFQCQICKVPFPKIITREGFSMEMITIDKPRKPYIILEGINQRKESREQRCLHVISPDDGNSIKMGRGHQCEIRLQDISVSRTHSEIKYIKGEFYIIDGNSKFGTLVKLDKSIELNSKSKLQIGRSLYEFNLVINE